MGRAWSMWSISWIGILGIAIATSASAQEEVVTSITSAEAFAFDFDDCRKDLSEPAAEPTTIEISFDLGKTGELSGIPILASPKAGRAERRLYRMAFDALLECLPLTDPDGVPTGTMTLRIAPERAMVVRSDITRTAPVRLAALPENYLKEPRIAGVSVKDIATERDEASLNLTRDKREEIQRRLTLLGFDTQGVDGVWGPKTRSALSAWQKENALSPSGFINSSQMAALVRASADAYAEWKKNAPRTSKRKARRVRVCNRGALGLLYNCRYEWR